MGAVAGVGRAARRALQRGHLGLERDAPPGSAASRPITALFPFGSFSATVSAPILSSARLFSRKLRFLQKSFEIWNL